MAQVLGHSMRPKRKGTLQNITASSQPPFKLPMTHKMRFPTPLCVLSYRHTPSPPKPAGWALRVKSEHRLEMWPVKGEAEGKDKDKPLFLWFASGDRPPPRTEIGSQ